MNNNLKSDGTPKYLLEHIDPNEFIMHPDKGRLQVGFNEKSPDVKSVMDNAFRLNPYPELPVLYTMIWVDSIERKAIIDGEARVSYAILYEVEKIPAIRVDIDVTDSKDALRKIMLTNQGYHNSFYEQGKAAAALFEEYSPGQGARTDIDGEKVEDINVFIASYIGDGKLSGEMAKKLRLVYNHDPQLLQQVDNGEIRSISVAYKMVVRKKKGDDTSTDNTYKDGMESEITTSTYEPEGYDSDVTDVDDNTYEVNSTETVEDAVEDIIPTTTKQDDGPTGLPEITFMVPRDKDWLITKCTCCNQDIKLVFIK